MRHSRFLAVDSAGFLHALKAEFFDFKTGKWTTVENYPYNADKYMDLPTDIPQVCHYDMLFIDELSSFFVFGGTDNVYLFNEIIKFQNGKWSPAGRLKTKRSVSIF